MGKVTQTTKTRNQSTALITAFASIFIFDNRFEEVVFKNNSGEELELTAGQLVVRDTAVAGGVLPATFANLADVIGISAYEGSTILADAETKNMNIGTKGTIDGNLLVLPDGVTLNTTVGNKSLRDVIEALGFHVDTSSVENTKIEQ